MHYTNSFHNISRSDKSSLTKVRLNLEDFWEIEKLPQRSTLRKKRIFLTSIFQRDIRPSYIELLYYDKTHEKYYRNIHIYTTTWTESRSRSVEEKLERLQESFVGEFQ